MPLTAAAQDAPLFDCVPEARIQKIEAIRAARARQEAFLPSPAYFPPIFMTDAERSFHYVAGLFYTGVDTEERSKTTLLAPLFLSICKPDSRTVVTPLHSYRTDAEGTAGLTLTWFWRRDRLVSTDVLFPIAWWTRERDEEGGPTVRGSGGVLPLFWASRDDAGDHLTLIPPLLYASWGDGFENTWVAGPAFGHSRGEEWRAGFFPVWFAGGDAYGRWDFVPPLLLYHETHGVETDLVAGPVVWHSDPQSWNLKVLPFLLFAGADDYGSHFVIPGLVANVTNPRRHTLQLGPFYRTATEESWHAGLVPFYFGGRWDDNYYDLAFPFFMRWGDGEKKTTSVGPVFWHTGPRGWSAGAIPFWVGGETETDRWDVAPPLLLYHHEDKANDERLLHVLNARYERRQEDWNLRIHPLVYSGREGENYHDVVLPLFARWGDADEHNLIAGPSWWLDRPDGWDRGVLPFYLGGRSPNEDYDIIPPLLFGRTSRGEDLTWFAFNTWYAREGEVTDLISFPFFFHHSEPDSSQTIIPPLIAWHTREGDVHQTQVLNFGLRTSPEGWRTNLFPLFFAGHEGESHHFVLAPIFWHYGEEGEELTVIPPGWYASDEDEDSWRLRVLPLLFAGRNKEDHHFHVPPLVFHWKDGDQHTTVVPPGWYQSRDDGWRAGLFPLFFGGRQDDTRWLFFPPLVWHFQNEESSTLVLGPFFDYDDGEDWATGVFPFWFGHGDGERRVDIVPPLLLWRERTADETRMWALQTWWSSSGDGHTLASFPFVFSGRHGDDHHLVIPPLLFGHWGDHRTEHTIAGPAWMTTHEKGWDAGLFPLVWAGRDGDAFHEVVLPGYARWGDATVQHLWLGPWFSTEREDRWTRLLLPLYFGHREPGLYWDVAPPFYARYEDAESTTHVIGLPVPLAIARHDDEADLLVLPPLLSHYRRSGPETFTANLGPAYAASDPDGWAAGLAPIWFSGRDQDRYYDLVLPLFARWGDSTRQSIVAGPFYNVETDTGWHGGLAPLYFAGDTGTTRYQIAPPLLSAHWEDEQGEGTWVANTIYSRRGDDWRLTSVPFVFAGKEDQNSWFIIPPLLAGRWSDGQTTTTGAANVWYTERRDGWGLSVFPILFAGRQGLDSHFTIPPLVWHWNNRYGSTTIVGPAWARSTPTGWSAGLAPIWFSGADRDKRWDVVAPFVWHFQDDESHRLTILPLFDWQKTRDAEHFYSPVFVWDTDPRGSLTVIGGLWWDVASRDSRARVLFPLWWDFQDLKADTRLSTFFPVYWRWQGENETTHVFLNLTWSSGYGPKGPSWSVHLVPIFKVQQRHPDHLKWVVLEGLAGYEREGQRKRYKAFYVWTDPTGSL